MFAIEAAIGLLALVISTVVIHFKMHRGFTKKWNNMQKTLQEIESARIDEQSTRTQYLELGC